MSEFPSAEFVRLADARLKAAYRHFGGVARIARQANGAAVIRNIAILELTALAESLVNLSPGEPS